MGKSFAVSNLCSGGPRGAVLRRKRLQQVDHLVGQALLARGPLAEDDVQLARRGDHRMSFGNARMPSKDRGR